MLLHFICFTKYDGAPKYDVMNMLVLEYFDCSIKVSKALLNNLLLTIFSWICKVMTEI